MITLKELLDKTFKQQFILKTFLEHSSKIILELAFKRTRNKD